MNGECRRKQLFLSLLKFISTRPYTEQVGNMRHAAAFLLPRERETSRAQFLRAHRKQPSQGSGPIEHNWRCTSYTPSTQ